MVMNSVDDVFAEVNLPRYKVEISMVMGEHKKYKDVVDVVNNDSILAIVKEDRINYYRIKHLRHWEVIKQ